MLRGLASCESSVTSPLDPLAVRLLQLLPSDGGSMGNTALQRLLGEAGRQSLDTEAYAAARDILLSVGAVTKGRGRGGSLRLSNGMHTLLAGAPAAAQSS